MQPSDANRETDEAQGNREIEHCVQRVAREIVAVNIGAVEALKDQGFGRWSYSIRSVHQHTKSNVRTLFEKIDRYIGIVKLAEIVVWILHQLEPPSPRTPTSPFSATAIATTVNGLKRLDLAGRQAWREIVVILQ
ncbi:hypothetical protein ACFX12_013003 [Malus domestica]